MAIANGLANARDLGLAVDRAPAIEADPIEVVAQARFVLLGYVCHHNCMLQITYCKLPMSWRPICKLQFAICNYFQPPITSKISRSPSGAGTSESGPLTRYSAIWKNGCVHTSLSGPSISNSVLPASR